MTDPREQLRSIRTFAALVQYLRDDLDWPITADDFEDLTYDYTPEELGIDSANAAKIEGIKRLRPLSARQPWGIFFITFEPKRLPVVALRRILGSLIIKKRATAASAERPAWSIDDLLFISNYGDGDERTMSFAHFSQQDTPRSMPTLKVLGWDNRDTRLHLEGVADQLKAHLTWPDDSIDTTEWRNRWSAAFTLRHQEVVTTSRELSIRLAVLARAVRDRIGAALTIETPNGPLTKLMDAFRQALIHDLDSSAFADMYAQTITYGLLSARIANPQSRNADDLARHMRTSPFLRELMEAFLDPTSSYAKSSGIDFDELGLGEVVDLLDRSNMSAVLRDFGDKNPLEDPVIHFYELFLTEYDPEKRMKRGVFYTPKAVVSYMVKCVDHELRDRFGLADGLADVSSWDEVARANPCVEVPTGMDGSEPFVQVLDPATGTGTFLVEVIELTHQTMRAKWSQAGESESSIDTLWNEYVPRWLLPRLHGYELLMAPYAIAHLKIGLKLFETGYRFEADERAQVYLTNALEPPHDFSSQLSFAVPALAHEAKAVNRVKDDRRFTVILGNPPYSSVSLNMNDWIKGLVADYMSVKGEALDERGNRNHLQDDYVKFWRLSEYLVSTTGVGISALITNNSYLSDTWYRGMRFQLLQTFNHLKVLNLHGGVGFSRQMSASDENVFDIKKSVAIALMLRTPPRTADCAPVEYAELIGTRETKYRTMLGESNYVAAEELSPGSANQWCLEPLDESNLGEWDSFTLVGGLFDEWGEAATTNRDGLAVSYTRDECISKAREFADLTISDESIESKYRFSSNYQWKTGAARRKFAAIPFQDKAEPYLRRPFDLQFIYWDKHIVYNMRGSRLDPLRGNTGNVALLFSRKTTKQVYTNFFVTSELADKQCVYNAKIAPLWIPQANDGLFEVPWLCNLASEPSTRLARSIGRNFEELQSRGTVDVVTPSDVFCFLYALCYSPTYRDRYSEFLKRDYPRFPTTCASSDLFDQLAGYGESLVGLHLFRESDDSGGIPARVSRLVCSGRPTIAVGYPKYTNGSVELSPNCRFGDVSADIWEMEIGGHQVCKKWLKDRLAHGGQGGVLAPEEVTAYDRILAALEGTRLLMQAIDKAINENGGWPDAFLTAAQGTRALAAEDSIPYQASSGYSGS